MNPKIFPFLATLAFLVAFAALAARQSPTVPTNATSEALSPVAAHDGFCTPVPDTATSLLPLAPGRFTAVISGKVRYVQACNFSADRVCVAMADGTGLTCALDSGTRGAIKEDQCLSFPVARDLDTLGPLPAFYGMAQAGTTATVCLDFFY